MSERHANDVIADIKRDAWLYEESGRTDKFQAWLDSLEPQTLRRAIRREKMIYKNYASPRR